MIKVDDEVGRRGGRGRRGRGGTNFNKVTWEAGQSQVSTL